MDRRRATTPPTRPLVLIVVPQGETRALCAIALSASGFDVVAVSNGVEAYSRALEIHPDIIVTDLPMRNSAGWQFLRDIKRTASTRDIPVVAVSDDVGGSLRASAEGDGFAA